LVLVLEVNLDRGGGASAGPKPGRLYWIKRGASYISSILPFLRLPIHSFKTTQTLDALRQINMMCCRIS
jgi:hypothetical protein